MTGAMVTRFGEVTEASAMFAGAPMVAMVADVVGET